MGEVFPEVVLPLTWKLLGRSAEIGWRRAFEQLGLLMLAAQARYESPTYQNVVHLRHAASDCNLAILGGFDRPLLTPPT